jgi:hypothetical protein
MVMSEEVSTADDTFAIEYRRHVDDLTYPFEHDGERNGQAALAAHRPESETALVG